MTKETMLEQVTVFKVIEFQVWEAARSQGILLAFGQFEELCEQVGDELDRRVPEIIKDVVSDYIYEKEKV